MSLAINNSDQELVDQAFTVEGSNTKYSFDESLKRRMTKDIRLEYLCSQCFAKWSVLDETPKHQ